jgi:hypothetical protein
MVEDPHARRRGRCSADPADLPTITEVETQDNETGTLHNEVEIPDFESRLGPALDIAEWAVAGSTCR